MVNREKFVHRETVVVSSEQLLPDCQGKDVIATRTASLDSELRPSLRRFLAISMLRAPGLYAHDSAFIIDVFGLFSSTAPCFRANASAQRIVIHIDWTILLRAKSTCDTPRVTSTCPL